MANRHLTKRLSNKWWVSYLDPPYDPPSRSPPMPLHIDCDGVPRRDFLRAGSLALGGLSLGSFLRMSAAGEVNSAAKAKAAIFINLRGGPSHMDSFDPKPESASEYRGEFNTISTKIPGVAFSEH